MWQVSMHAHILVSVHVQVIVANSESLTIYKYTNLNSVRILEQITIDLG